MEICIRQAVPVIPPEPLHLRKQLEDPLSVELRREGSSFHPASALELLGSINPPGEENLFDLAPLAWPFRRGGH